MVEDGGVTGFGATCPDTTHQPGGASHLQPRLAESCQQSDENDQQEWRKYVTRHGLLADLRNMRAAGMPQPGEVAQSELDACAEHELAGEVIVHDPLLPKGVGGVEIEADGGPQCRTVGTRD